MWISRLAIAITFLSSSQAAFGQAVDVDRGPGTNGERRVTFTCSLLDPAGNFVSDLFNHVDDPAQTRAVRGKFSECVSIPGKLIDTAAVRAQERLAEWKETEAARLADLDGQVDLKSKSCSRVGLLVKPSERRLCKEELAVLKDSVAGAKRHFRTESEHRSYSAESLPVSEGKICMHTEQRQFAADDREAWDADAKHFVVPVIYVSRTNRSSFFSGTSIPQRYTLNHFGQQKTVRTDVAVDYSGDKDAHGAGFESIFAIEMKPRDYPAEITDFRISCASEVL